jgi:predicted ATP-grasp superfamily ATP-dependent carboligase
MTGAKRVLLTGARAPFTLGLARHLNDHGHRVVAADSMKYPITRFSRAAAAFYFIPRPAFAYEAFMQALVEIAQRERIEVLIPTCEEIFYIAHGREALAPWCPVFADTLEKLLTLHNKWTFNQEAQRLGLPVPRTWLLQSPEDAVAAFERGLVFKPAYSRFAAYLVMCPEEKEEVAKLPISPTCPWVAQRFVPGREVCTYSVAHAGALTAHVAYTSLLQRGPGPSIASEVIDHPACLAWVERFVQGTRFTGQIAFDFIEEPDGRVQAIECNPRATSGTLLFDATEDLPGAFFNADSPVRFAQPGRRIRGAGLMIKAGIASLTSPTAFRAWWRAFKSSRDIYLRRDDPLPSLAEGFTNGAWIYRSLKYKLSVEAATTFDIEWNAESGSRSDLSSH